MNKAVLYLRSQKENYYHVLINAMEGWENFEELVKFLKENYNAFLLESVDGPDARRWIFKIDGHKIDLSYDDVYGNYLKAYDFEGEKLITRIGEDLEERLKNI